MNKKIALVTGASGGIGRAIALALAKDDVFVIINYNGSADKANETKRLIDEAGKMCVTMKFNVGDTEEVNQAVKEIIEKYGRLDILVNNSGITRDGLIMKMSDAQYDEVLAVNLKGTFNTIRCVSRQMMKQKCGRIINITSVSGILGNAGQANYSASKAGVIGLTKSVARELSSRNITVNAVAPGFIETDMTSGLPERVREAATSQIPLGHFGNPEDVAAMVRFLASDEAAYITGQIIAVDGGMAM